MCFLVIVKKVWIFVYICFFYIYSIICIFMKYGVFWRVDIYEIDSNAAIFPVYMWKGTFLEGVLYRSGWFCGWIYLTAASGWCAIRCGDLKSAAVGWWLGRYCRWRGAAGWRRMIHWDAIGEEKVGECYQIWSKSWRADGDSPVDHDLKFDTGEPSKRVPFIGQRSWDGV